MKTSSVPTFDPAKYELRAEVLKAMASPVRLYLLDLLAGGERQAGELAEQVSLDPSTVSRHLAVLAGAGLVGRRREGVKVFYFLLAPCALSFMQCVESVLKDREMRAARAAGGTDET